MSVKARIEKTLDLNLHERKLSHKEVRCLWKKARKKEKRREAAKRRQEENKGSLDSTDTFVFQPSKEELEYEQTKARWIQKEAEIEAQNQRIKKEREELAARLAKEVSQIPVKTTERAISLTKSKIEIVTWHNPLNDSETNSLEKCPFYEKVGACRYGNKCKRRHEKPAISNTMVIRGMYASAVNYVEERDKFDAGITLEQEELFDTKEFLDFRGDVLQELKNYGKIDRFYACCNFAHHLRGNVYVQFRTEIECATAVKNCMNRWYGGKPLFCEFVSIENWGQAICGSFKRRGNCSKGSRCNYLHVINHSELSDLCRNRQKRPTEETKESRKKLNRHQT